MKPPSGHPLFYINRARQILQRDRLAAEQATREQAIVLYQAGSVHEARQLLVDLTDAGALSEWTWLWLARAELEMDDVAWDVVRKATDRALKIRPRWEKALQIRAGIKGDNDARPIIVPLLGLSGTMLIEAATDLRRFLAPNSVIVVTDCLDFTALHRAKLSFEYVPARDLLAPFLNGQQRETFHADRIEQIRRERRAGKVFLRTYLAPRYDEASRSAP